MGTVPQSGADRRAANTMADCSDISSELNMSASSDTPDPVPPLTIRVHSPAVPPRQERLPRTRAVYEIFTIFNGAFSLLNSHSHLPQYHIVQFFTDTILNSFLNTVNLS